MRLRLSKITDASGQRPPGYAAAVLARGVVDGEWLEISSEALADLRAEYRPVTAPALPPISAMLITAATAVAAECAARASGVPAHSAEEVARRLAICTGPAGGWCCESYRESDQRCALCGCLMRFKARLRSSSCPAGKW